MSDYYATNACGSIDVVDCCFAKGEQCETAGFLQMPTLLSRPQKEYRKERFMASCASIHGSPIGAFKHDLRERDVYKNEDIDKSKSHLNYTLSSHGKTSKDCKTYFDSLLDGVYHRGGTTVNSAEWSFQFPSDLSPERAEEFFQSTYDFCNHIHFDGDDRRCILAQVHRDEVGADHMHYVFTFPEVKNEKYVEFNDKFVSGVAKIHDHFDVELKDNQIHDCYSAIQSYESRSYSAREKETIQEIGRVLDLKRDEARWCFTRMRRLDSERYATKLMSKDEFLTSDFFNSFHKEYQQWLTNHGFDCTVYRGGKGGIKLTVEQLKEITKETGITLDKGLSVEYVTDLIKENSRLQERISDLERSQEIFFERQYRSVEEILR